MFEKIVNLLGEILRNFYPEIDFSDDNIRKRKSEKESEKMFLFQNSLMMEELKW